MRRSTRLIACAAMLAAFAFVRFTAHADRGRDGHQRHGHGHHGHKKPRTTVRGILEHQQALQNIADVNGGTRHTRTPGYTASAAYVKATLEKAGYNVRYEMFNMPEWHETAPPVFQQLTPTNKTYAPGTAADDDTRPSTSSPSSTRRPVDVTNVAGRPDERHRDPEPGGEQQQPAASRRTSQRRRAAPSR